MQRDLERQVFNPSCGQKVPYRLSQWHRSGRDSGFEPFPDLFATAALPAAAASAASGPAMRSRRGQALKIPAPSPALTWVGLIAGRHCTSRGSVPVT